MLVDAHGCGEGNEKNNWPRKSAPQVLDTLEHFGALDGGGERQASKELAKCAVKLPLLPSGKDAGLSRACAFLRKMGFFGVERVDGLCRQPAPPHSAWTRQQLAPLHARGHRVLTHASLGHKRMNLL